MSDTSSYQPSPRLAWRNDDPAPLQHGAPGGTSGGMDDIRLTAVESRLSGVEGRLAGIETEQRTHFRWSIGTLIAATLGLASLIFATANFLTGRVDRIEDRMTRLEGNLNDLPGKLTSSLNQVNQTLLQAVTASKQTPPQVILLETPAFPIAPKSSGDGEPGAAVGQKK
jgi:hypothetical protein